MPGRSVRIISHARTEPRGTETSTVKKPQIKEFFSGPHSTAAGQLTGEDVFPVVQGEIAHVALNPAQLALSQRKGAGDHGQQRDDDEAEQDDETDQHHHVKGVFQHIQDQVL